MSEIMSQHSIIARLAALETLSASCFTFLLASSGNDPDLSKAKAILEVVKQEADKGLADLPPITRGEAKRYLAGLIENILQNVTKLRGGPITMQ